MKLIKPIFSIIIVFLFLAQNSFTNLTPIPGVGNGVKKIFVELSDESLTTFASLNNL